MGARKYGIGGGEKAQTVRCSGDRGGGIRKRESAGSWRNISKTLWKKKYVDKLSEQKETDIMGKSHEKDVNPVHFVCKLDKSIYSVVSSDIQSGDVIITDERIGHIKDHHPNDYETFIGYIPQIIESPDYIVASPKPHTAVVLKMIEENGEKFKVILRLRVEGDPAHYKHSIISFWRIGDTTWRKTLKNKVILYSRR